MSTLEHQEAALLIALHHLNQDTIPNDSIVKAFVSTGAGEEGGVEVEALLKPGESGDDLIRSSR